MLPRVIIHNAVSADGRIQGFEPDVALYYETVRNWSEDCTLAGSETILTGSPAAADEEPPLPIEPPAEGDERPLLAVVDSQGRVRGWNHLRSQPYWRGVIALVAESTPPQHLEYLRDRNVPTIVHGLGKVDLKRALEELAADFGVRVVRVDSGGVLNGVLLRQGLVNVVSLLVSPVLVGGDTPSSMFRAPAPKGYSELVNLKLLGVERLEGDIAWLRYMVVK